MKDNIVEDTEIWAYVSKTADKPILSKIETWKNSPDFNEQRFNTIAKLYETTAEKPYTESINVEDEKAKFFETVAPTVKKNNRLQRYFKYAAAVVLFISIAGIAYQNLSNSTVTVAIIYGEEKKVELSDGSTVWLNSGSSISYKKDEPRTIELNGEAFFEVAKDKAHPFTVETPDHVVVKALGTSFNVKAYPENSYLETTLLTGKVEVTSENYFDEKIIMLPNDNIKILKVDGIPIKSTIQNKKTVLLWRENKIRFENMAFRDIANDLNNQLNIKLVFKNTTIAESRFTAVFDKSTPVEDILEVLQDTKNFTYNLNPETNEWMIK